MASYLTRLTEMNSSNLQPIATAQTDPLTVASEDANLTIAGKNDNPMQAATLDTKSVSNTEKLSSDISYQSDSSKETHRHPSVNQERSNINNVGEVNSSIIRQPIRHTPQGNNNNEQVVNDKSKNEAENLAINRVETMAAANKHNAATSSPNTLYPASQISNSTINQAASELINSNFTANNLKLAATDISQTSSIGIRGNNLNFNDSPLLPTSTYSDHGAEHTKRKNIIMHASTNIPQINPIGIRENNLNFNDNSLLPVSTYSDHEGEHTKKNNMVVHNYSAEDSVVQHIHKQNQTAHWDLNEKVDTARHSSKQPIQVNVNINHLEMRKLSSAPIINSQTNKRTNATLNKLSLKDYLKQRKLSN